MWELLETFATADVVQHPRGYPRIAADYRSSMHTINERLARQVQIHMSAGGGEELEESEVQFV